MQLSLDSVSKKVGPESWLYEMSLAPQPGAVTVLLGATQAGKTSLMRIMAGLDVPTQGRVRVDGTDVVGLPVRERNVAMVYQQFINYPSLKVRDNIASPLKLRGEKNIAQRVTELAEKLGPIVWEFAPGRVFDPTDFAAFLALLPARQDGVALRHVLEVRHPSFQDPAFVALAREHGCAIVFTDSDKFPNIDENTADFNYARLLMASPDQPRGYSDPALDGWAEKARQWADGNRRDVFVFFINGAKERAPAAAGALLGRLGLAPLA